MHTFSTESLIRAMHLPIDDVIHNFQEEQNKFGYDCQGSEPLSCFWTSEVAQGRFAEIITRIVKPTRSRKKKDRYNSKSNKDLVFEPGVRYIRKLLQRYASLIEQVDSSQIENDDLAEVLMEYQFRSREFDHGTSNNRINDDNVPNPLDSCHVSFIVPNNSESCDDNVRDSFHFHIDSDSNNLTDKNNIIGIKVYPHHNDVGVRKVWEAGAALAEFLFKNPQLVKAKDVCELGAGVGLTGLFIAGLCQTRSVHLTDYTNVTLENLEYNVSINYDWILQSRKRERIVGGGEFRGIGTHQIITTGFLEWDDFINASDNVVVDSFVPSIFYKNEEGKQTFIHQKKSQSLSLASNADVLIAADVVYDRSVIPQLIQVVKCILTMSSPNKSKIAIFASTYRNAESFALFLKEIENCSSEIDCEFVDSDILNSMPYIFPCYSVQPRSHVRICIMRIKQGINN